MLAFAAFFFLLAGRVFAEFSITLGQQVLFPPDFLAIPSSLVPSECGANCAAANQSIIGCNNNAACLCQSSVVDSLRGCQQCMFTQVIAKNEKVLDLRVGSSPLMTGYSTACLADGNVTLAANETALVLPASWDGPLDVILSTGGTVVAVGVGGVLGLAAIMLLSNMN
ncbi:hypothetical protein AGABI2DRAFT_195160 [Agaricus bisporus var. bisporus H97]|uniref:hypothetical protein n=1 Tax=Agaricus bisporus var. bisporus (strain H97 / ATCC MYA-4626 / FGSC 10389) TaxID=936046 RepID=UPI00029F5480|nr:hypothetical protein AGABI2DRAFT_195160 [Agaricus bisporus var. bisporus H97]EKV43563.1 hypothetical protein AGABI2DRAFT_195160 [Agaricus bisporus var. bisporus H97]